MNSKDAAMLGEHLDRRFPVRLQLPEDERYRAAMSNLRTSETQSSSSGLTARKAKNQGPKIHPVSYHRKVTENNPIKLYSDDDDGMTGSADREHALRAAEAGDPMDLDEDDGDLTYNRDLKTTEASMQDALLAQQLQEEDRPQHTVVRRRDCIVCGDSILITEFPSLSKCEHIPQTCAVCYSTWIARQLEDSGWKEARCPENKCKTKLEYYEIQQTVTPEIFQRFHDMIARHAIGEDREFPQLHRTSNKLTSVNSQLRMVSKLRLRSDPHEWRRRQHLQVCCMWPQDVHYPQEYMARGRNMRRLRVSLFRSQRARSEGTGSRQSQSHR